MKKHRGLLGVAALGVFGLTLLSNTLGFGREIINAQFFGAGAAMDAFLAAATIPLAGISVISATVSGALIPALATAHASNRVEEQIDLESTAVATSAVLFALTAIVLALTADRYVPILFPGFHKELLAQCVQMTRLLMLTIFPSGLAAVFSAILNARGRFALPAAQPIALNVATIIIVLLASHSFGIQALLWGTVIGLILQPIILLPSFSDLIRSKPRIDLTSPMMIGIWAALLPLLISAGTAQVALMLDRYFASTLGAGTIADLAYVQRLISVPQQLLATALGTAAFPLFARSFHAKEFSETRHYLAKSIQVLFFITVPVCLLMWLYSQTVISAIFEHGAFTAMAAAQCATLLPYGALLLVPVSLNIVIIRAAWAFNKIPQSVAIGAVAILLNAALSVSLLPKMGARGLLLANFLSQSVQAVILLCLIRRVIGDVDVRNLTASGAKTLAAGVAMAGTILMMSRMGPPIPGSALLGGATGFGAFILTAALLKSSEVRELIARVVSISRLGMKYQRFGIK